MLDKVSYWLPVQRTQSVCAKGYRGFDSRDAVLGNIIKASADANNSMIGTNNSMIGVYGMPGVGKTTLVNKVAGEVREINLFDIAVKTDVTKTPDLKRIQARIADPLRLKFEEESEGGRADRLRERLKKEKGRVLILLDDVWQKIDLDAVGIPIGNHQSREQRLQLRHKTNDDKRCCKILLTSRNVDVLHDQMDAYEVFSVDPLSINEAKDLFEKIVGNKPEMSNYQSTAAEIVEKCGGLPLAITTIANALKHEDYFNWQGALDQLSGSNPSCIPGVTDTLYSTIQLSYHMFT